MAETAGVSIGTLYQYFPNKEAILVALMHQGREGAIRESAALIAAGMDVDRAQIRTMIAGFPGRPATRRAALRALRSHYPQLNRGIEAPAMRAGRSEVEAFVVTRAVVEVVRAAVMEDSPLLHTQEFEDTLVRLSRALWAP